MIFETHAHYDDEQFNDDRGELLSELPSCGIKKVINVCASMDSLDTTVELANAYDHVYAAIGIHPTEIEGDLDTVLNRMRKIAENPKVIAIGEIGLDYYWEKDPEVQAIQRQWFEAQLELARELNLPVIIHSRDAAEETMNIMKAHHCEELQGVIHCYSYSLEMAMEWIKMGWYIGIGGVITFKNAKKLVATLQQIPMERVLLETDCPYMCPEPHRGRRNDSRELKYVVEKIAALRGITPAEVEDITWDNAGRLFKIVN